MAKQRKTILLLQADGTARCALHTSLTEAGYDVAAAGDVAEAIRLWQERQGADLAIIDMDMPVQEGLECIIQLRTHTPGVPIIALTGVSISAHFEVLGQVTLLATLRKPFLPRALLALVDLELSRLR